jgi:DNA-binding HxlR family transcriptional regulator
MVQVTSIMKTKKRVADTLPRRSDCAVANTLERIGDRWSLLLVRDMLAGKSTYGQFLESPEGIPTNILAERLKRLERNGIITRSAYQEHPVRYAYALTASGRQLGGILRAVATWGLEHIPKTRTLSALLPAPRSAGRRQLD